MKNIIISVFIIFFLMGCHSSENTDNSASNTISDTHSGQYRKRFRGWHQSSEFKNLIIKGDTVYVPEGSNIISKIKLQTVKTGDCFMQFTTTGVVKPVSGHLAEVSSPFSGRIVKSFVKLGQKVSVGSPLFEVSSSEYLEAVKMCLQARHEREVAERNYLRKNELAESGIISKKELDEAKLTLDLAEKECEKTNAILKIYNINTIEADLDQPLIVRAPISGEVVRNDITVGQYIKPESEPIVTIADLDRVWVVARVKEKEIGMINPDDDTGVFTESFPGREIKGKIKYIGGILSEQTRSVDVYVECDNPEKILKPGMFVTVKFSHRVSDAILIPASSVLQDFDKTYLFEKIGPYSFVRREITVTSKEDINMLVLSGLEAGRTIVTEGAIYLR